MAVTGVPGAVAAEIIGGMVFTGVVKGRTMSAREAVIGLRGMSGAQFRDH